MKLIHLYKKLSFAIISCMLLLPVFTMASNIQNAYQHIKNSNLPSIAKADSLYSLINRAMVSDTFRLDTICSDFKAFALAKNDNTMLAYAYLLKGNLAKNNNQLAEAITNYLVGINLLDSITQKKKLCSAYQSLAYAYTRSNNFLLASSPMQKALSLAEELNDGELLFEAYNAIGISFIREKLFEDAIDFYRKAINAASRVRNKEKLSKVYTNLGIAYRNIGNYDSALFYHNGSLKLALETQNKYNIAFALNDLGVIYSRIDNYDKALDYLFQSVKIREEIGESFELGFTYNFIAECLINQGKYQETEKYAKKAVAVSFLSNNIRQRYESYEILSVLFEVQNKFDSAYHYLQKHTMLKENFLRERNKFSTDALVASYQFEEKEKEIKLLNEISQNQELQIQKQNLYLISSIVGLLLFSIIIVLVVRDRKQKSAKILLKTQLKEEAMRREASERLQQEKERISRDLHDNVGGQLSYVLYSLDGMNTDNPAKRVEITQNVNESVRNVIGNLRETIWAISDEVVSVSNFSDKLKVYTRNMFKNTSTKIFFQENIEIESTLNSFVGLNLFRICQEIINNAFKYANASELNILVSASNSLCVEIADNGVGFDLANITHDSYGLKNIKNRAQEAGISLHLQAMPNQGVIYKLELPFIES